MWNLPNILSVLRIFLIPVLTVVFLLPNPNASVWAMAIFVIASLTDWLDGYLARRWQQTSPFGAFIDPVADKLLVAVALLLVLQKTPVWYVLLPVIIIIGREITVSALREWMAELGQRNAVKVSNMGKWKTAFQMLSVSCLIYFKPLMGLPIFEVGIVLLYIASALTLLSMFNYLQAAWPMLSGKG